jgi:hypothetical protein
MSTEQSRTIKFWIDELVFSDQKGTEKRNDSFSDGIIFCRKVNFDRGKVGIKFECNEVYNVLC